VLANQSKIYNGDFSTGTYSGWRLNGSGFGKLPLNITAANQNGAYYRNQWSNYNGQYFATTYSQMHNYAPGTVYTSFVVVEPYLNFQIISAPNPDLYVEILQNSKPVIIVHYNTPNATNGLMNQFASASINVTSLMCKTIQVSVVSNVYEATAAQQSQFIAVGNFQQSQSQSQTSGIVSSSEILNSSS
jgi:hypothetical protein